MINVLKISRSNVVEIVVSSPSLVDVKGGTAKNTPWHTHNNIILASIVLGFSNNIT